MAIEAVHEMHRTGDWLVPRLAGEPWLEDPPFYYWLALGFAKLFGGLLGFHNAVRLASGFAVLAACLLLFFNARSISSGEDRQTLSAAAPLLLIGSVGLMVHAHEAVPDLAALAATCGALFFLFAGLRTWLSGLGFGVSLGAAFLSAGPVMPIVLLAAVALAHLACDEWRNARAALFLAPAAAAFLASAASWPVALWLRAPGLASGWWFDAWHGRGDFLANLQYYLGTASWATWPAWPLAAWAVWTLRKHWRAPRVFVPLAAALLALPAIAYAGPQQDINTIALIAPLALLGAQGVPALRRGAANALDWFGVMTFTFFAGLVWLGYLAMLTGVPPRVMNNMLKTAPGFVFEFEALRFSAGLALALAWLYLAFWTAPSPSRGATRWAAGVALLWGSFAMLLMPWADHIKSYRGVALQLRSALPAGAGCVSQRALGSPQRAALSYHAGIRTQPAPFKGATACPLLIVQGHPRHEADAPGAGWRKLADVGRPGDRGERYRLYRRGPGK
jgi:4-amino-4-deoxy-L-arabinose transferase-like glycosyltransferase